MSGCSLFQAPTTVAMPLSQSVSVRWTTWPVPDADEDADVDEDADEEADEDEAAVVDEDDDPELQAASVSTAAVRAPAMATPGLAIFTLIHLLLRGDRDSAHAGGMRFPS